MVVLKRNAQHLRDLSSTLAPLPRLPRSISHIFEGTEFDAETETDNTAVEDTEPEPETETEMEGNLPVLLQSPEPRRVIHESAIRAMTLRSEALRALFKKFGNTEEEREAKVREIPERGLTEDELREFSSALVGDITEREMRYLRDQFLG